MKRASFSNRIGTLIPQKELLTSVGLGKYVAMKPLARIQSPYFPENCRKTLWISGLKFPPKSRFSRAL